MASIREDFVTFISKGNLVQLAVAFVMGAAFSGLVTALVADIFTPLIGVGLRVNFAGWQYTVNGSTFLQGAFLNSLISFITISLVVFFVIALPYQRFMDRRAAKKPAAPATTRACPECLSQIPLAARRCSFCTSVVAPLPSGAATPAA
jgi:large conductance mechanosensitive channel